MRLGRTGLVGGAAVAGCFAVGAAAGVVADDPQPAARADFTYQPTRRWNGERVYLSPATHSDTGSRGECFWDENRNGFEAGYAAATGDFGGNQNLRQRGYQVAVGTGTNSQKIANSNAWGADLHVPLHSNAIPNPYCSDNRSSRYGTWVIYQSSGGSIASEHIVNWVGGSSPGRNDFKCHVTSGCTAFNTLAELSQTRAIAAYTELEFHSWKTGSQWLADPRSWAWRLAAGIDEYFGRPR